MTRESAGETQLIDLPADSLTQQQLQRWIGHTLAERAFAAPGRGPVGDTHRIGEGRYSLEVLEIENSFLPEPDSLDPEYLRSIYTRVRREQALARSLEELRSNADIAQRASTPHD